MINIHLVKKGGLSLRKLEKKLRRGWFNDRDERIILFPENTLNPRFKRSDFEEYLSQLNLDENTATFFSVFVREQDPDPNVSSIRLFFQGNLDQYSFKNNGYLLHGGLPFENYVKRISTEFDNSNSGTGMGVEFIDDKFDFSQKKITFPKITLEGRIIEFRLCRDIECGSTNNPDIVLCSAYGLRNYEEAIKRSLEDKTAIIHDITQANPIVYHAGDFYQSRYAIRKAKELGINLLIK